MDSETQRLRAMLAPQPTYPAPWRLGRPAAARRDHHHIVVCDSGGITAECPTEGTAAIIVTAVNAFATGYTCEQVRVGAENAIKVGQAIVGDPGSGPYPATVTEVAEELVSFINELDNTTARGVAAIVWERLGNLTARV